MNLFWSQSDYVVHMTTGGFGIVFGIVYGSWTTQPPQEHENEKLTKLIPFSSLLLSGHLTVTWAEQHSSARFVNSVGFSRCLCSTLKLDQCVSVDDHLVPHEDHVPLPLGVVEAASKVGAHLVLTIAFKMIKMMFWMIR